MLMRLIVSYTNLTLITIIVWFVDNKLLESVFWLKFKSINVGVLAIKCYTCDGSCYSQSYCNCQTGMCEGQYCFSERYGGVNPFVRKGCGRGKMKMDYGCEEQKAKNSTLCYCNGEDFCNYNLIIPDKATANVSCNLCSSTRGRCTNWCYGDFCWINALYDVRKCGIGSLSLPYHYSNPSLLYSKYANEFDQGTACVNVMAGKSYRVKECICNGNHYCNHRLLPDTSLKAVAVQQKLLTCYSCEAEVHDPAVPPASCKQNTCVGQFCFLLLQSQTADRGNIALQRHAGCLNTTRPYAVVLGCNQRWALEKWEYLECTCQKEFCNQDVNTAYAAVAAKNFNTKRSLIAVVLFTFIKIVISILA